MLQYKRAHIFVSLQLLFPTRFNYFVQDIPGQYNMKSYASFTKPLFFSPLLPLDYTYWK